LRGSFHQNRVQTDRFSGLRAFNGFFKTPRPKISPRPQIRARIWGRTSHFTDLAAKSEKNTVIMVFALEKLAVAAAAQEKFLAPTPQNVFNAAALNFSARRKRNRFQDRLKIFCKQIYFCFHRGKIFLVLELASSPSLSSVSSRKRSLIYHGEFL